MKKWENSFPTFSSENLPYNYIILTDDADTYASVIDEKLKGYNVISELEYAKYAPQSEHYYGGMKKDLMDAVGAYLTGNSSLDEAGTALKEAVENNLD